MSEETAQEIEGTLITAGPSREEMARYSAARTAVGIAKQIPAGAGESVESRAQDVLTIADRLYTWLTADTEEATA